MFAEFSSWLGDNPGFYPCLDDVLSRLGRKASVLCCGEYSLHAALILREYVDSPVDVLLKDAKDIPWKEHCRCLEKEICQSESWRIAR